MRRGERGGETRRNALRRVNGDSERGDEGERGERWERLGPSCIPATSELWITARLASDDRKVRNASPRLCTYFIYICHFSGKAEKSKDKK